MLKFIYQLFEYFITHNITSVKNVMLYQEDNESRDPIQNPSIEIEIVESEPEQFGNGYQQWIQPINLYVNVDVYGDIKYGADLKEKSLNYLTLMDTIYKELNALCSYDLPEELQSSDYQISDIVRMGISFPSTPGNVKTSIVKFNVVMEDYSQVPTLETIILTGVTSTYLFTGSTN